LLALHFTEQGLWAYGWQEKNFRGVFSLPPRVPDGGAGRTQILPPQPTAKNFRGIFSPRSQCPPKRSCQQTTKAHGVSTPQALLD